MEAILVEEYKKVLSHDFYWYPEIWGKSTISGKTKRVDAVIISKTNPNLKFGIEFKRVDLGSFNNFTAWFKQSLIYTQCEFGTMGKIPILIAPAFNYGENKFDYERFLGEFGIGQIDKFHYKASNEWVYKIQIKGNSIYTSPYNGQPGTFSKVYSKTDFTSRLEL